jgi:dipeptidyl aminopeptidase/acylaminoacyl peptidase
MRRILFLLAMSAGATVVAQRAGPFTLQQILSAPYALDLTAAPVGARFAWVENAQGVRNVWVGGPREAARKITPYTDDDAQDINGLTWSPDASAVAYAYGAPNGANGRPANPAHLQRATPVEIMVQPVAAGAKAIELGEGHAPLFTRDGRSVLFVRSGEIWSAEVADGAATARRLVFDRGSASGMTLSPDGSLLAYVSRRGAHSFIVLFDLHEKTLRFVSPSVGRDFAPAFSPDGKRIAWLRAPFTEPAEFAANRVSPDPWSVMIADVARPEESRAVFTPEKNKPGSVLPHTATGEPHVWWMPDGRLAFLAEMDGWVHLYDVSASGGHADLLTPGKGEVEDVAQGPHGELVWASNVPTCAGVCDLKDEDRRHLWRLGAKGAEALTRGEDIEAKPQMAADGTMAALVSNATVPMHPALVASDGVVTTLRPGEWPKEFPIAAVKLLEPQQVLIPEAGVTLKGVAEDDVRVSLHGKLFEPAGVGHADSSVALRNDKKETLHPALIFFHGGPMREMLLGYPAMEYYSNAYAMNQYLASQGFVVLSVNYHCGVGYGTDFRQCVHAGAAGASEYADVLAAVKWLRAQKNVDVKRIGVWGGSYGGYLTALALARNSNLFAAGVDFHGVHDWILEDNNADWLRGTNAEKAAIAKTAFASSPMADVQRWTSPVLLIHGDNDGNVAFNQTPALADALRARSVPVEELIFPDEIHEFLLHSDWLKAYTAEAEFFDRILKP